MGCSTVLVVDDNRDLLHFLARLMTEAGWKLLAAESAGEARKVAAHEPLDAALLDYTLPDGNGVELGAQLRQAESQGSRGHYDRLSFTAGRRMSDVNYFFGLTTIISPYQRQLFFDS